jgi:Mg-chelatase subunit ChlD
MYKQSIHREEIRMSTKVVRTLAVRLFDAMALARNVSAAALVLLTQLAAHSAAAQTFAPGAPGGYGLKIYSVNYGLYPFVQVYFRTFDANMRPLVNLNERNIGLMVKGRAYDPTKRQYLVNTLRQRQEAIRSVLVLDASKSMAGAPFNAALRAAARFIDSKRPQDEVAILSIRDTPQGYDVVSLFERDAAALGRRLMDVRADGNKTRLYDALGAAMQMCGMTAQGSVAPSPENYVVSCSVVVLSDGKDEGSALSREEINNRITSMSIPIPIYSLAYSNVNPAYFRNLEALSKNSFGIYFPVGKTVDRMQTIVEDIQNILQSDYVLTFRSYIPPDGESHALKIGVEYPSGSGKFSYEGARFEAIEPPPVGGIKQQLERLSETIPAAPDGDPYFASPAAAPREVRHE